MGNSGEDEEEWQVMARHMTSSSADWHLCPPRRDSPDWTRNEKEVCWVLRQLRFMARVTQSEI